MSKQIRYKTVPLINGYNFLEINILSFALNFNQFLTILKSCGCLIQALGPVRPPIADDIAEVAFSGMLNFDRYAEAIKFIDLLVGK